MTSCFLSVAKLHFSTVRSSYNLPHTIALQLNFLRRNHSGSATFTVFELKLGRRTSAIHIALSQDDSNSPSVVGYFTQSNLNTESGISLSTGYSLSPPPVPLSSPRALRNSEDARWVLHKNPFSRFRKAAQHARMYLPRDGQPAQALIDQWLCLENGEGLTAESLGFVAGAYFPGPFLSSLK